MMINLVKITLMNCDRCEEFPLFGQLPKLREMVVNGMNKVKVIGSDSYGGLDSDCKAAKTVTTIYPSLTTHSVGFARGRRMVRTGYKNRM